MTLILLVTTATILIAAAVYFKTPIGPTYAVDCIEQDGGSGAWLKGYNDAHSDFHGLNGHGFDDSTHFKGDDKGHYKSRYTEGFNDAANGKKLPMC
jgi:hypothetical protein